MIKTRIPHVEVQVEQLKNKEMVRQDNSEPNLRFLLVTDEITLKEYFFRQGAEAMNIKTYEL
jgi:hypothetical protein|tara:strand:- start:1088 stop:1273 length:186 start_codon:yes stop_codon:yes gene_type:complete